MKSKTIGSPIRQIRVRRLAAGGIVLESSSWFGHVKTWHTVTSGFVSIREFGQACIQIESERKET